MIGSVFSLLHLEYFFFFFFFLGSLNIFSLRLEACLVREALHLYEVICAHCATWENKGYKGVSGWTDGVSFNPY